MTESEDYDGLPPDIAAETSRLIAQGDALFEAHDFVTALTRYNEAWRLIPDPRADWEISAPLLTAMADAFFFLGDFETVISTLEFAMRCREGLGNPFIHLRLGQAAFELGDFDRAEDEMMHAYLVAGADIFKNETDKYIEFLRERGAAM